MSAREPSDAEIDAAFNDIVARLTEAGGDADQTWAAQRPLFEGETPDTDRESDALDDALDDEPDDELADEPVLRGEVLDPAPDPRHDGADDTGDESLGWRVHRPPDDDELDELDELDLDELPRTPLPPWRPSSVALAALVLVAGSALVTLLLIFQVRLPWWAGWAALVGFLVGMGLLFTRLPRDRDEDSDDGAVV